MLTAATLVIGVEIKGARRWISLPGLSIQPSEFLKPCFAIVAAWLIAEGRRTPRFPGQTAGRRASSWLIALLLKSQPDIGMLAVIIAVFFAQLYVAGLNLFLVGIGAAASGFAGVGAYTFFPHVQKRVENFLHPGNAGGDYQPPPRWKRSAMAGCSAAAPARGGSRTCCRTRMPTSSSPSPARNSA